MKTITEGKLTCKNHSRVFVKRQRKLFLEDLDSLPLGIFFNEFSFVGFCIFRISTTCLLFPLKCWLLGSGSEPIWRLTFYFYNWEIKQAKSSSSFRQIEIFIRNLLLRIHKVLIFLLRILQNYKITRHVCYIQWNIKLAQNKEFKYTVCSGTKHFTYFVVLNC